MTTAICLTILLLWILAIFSACQERLPWETTSEWRHRRSAEISRKTVT